MADKRSMCAFSSEDDAENTHGVDHVMAAKTAAQRLRPRNIM
jgi:hypothetical protein